MWGINQKDVNIKSLYEQGLSAPVIANELKIPLHTVYGSLVRQRVSRRSTTEQNRIRFENKAPSFRFKEHLSILDKELLAAGLMLYSGEGAKTGTTVDFANSNPHALQVFLVFLRVVCGVDESRLRFYLYCFSDQNTHELITYWSKLLRVSKKNFTKPYVRDSVNKGQRVMSNGVLHIRYSDKKLLDKILYMSKEMSNRLAKYEGAGSEVVKRG